jgi:capsular exopolysaccharide synthesis family protein
MSRVTDAMRRTGHHDDQPVIRTDDMPFVGGDDAVRAEDSVADPGAAIPLPAAGLELLPSPGAVEARAPIVPLHSRKESAEDVQLQDIVRVLLRRRWMICTIVIAGVLAAAVYNSMATPIYQALARVLIEPDTGQVVPFQGVGTDPGRDDYLLTQLDVLRSRALAQKTLDRLQQLPKNPTLQSEAIDRFQSNLSVTPTQSANGTSRVVNIRYSSINPQVAARMANALAETYVAQNLETRRSGSREAATWLSQRLNELRKTVGAGESALQEYREQKNAVGLEDSNNILNQKLSQVNAAYTSARTERVAKEALYQQLVAMEQTNAPLDTFPAIVGNTFIQGLKADLAVLQRERVQLSERLGNLHPDMIKIDTAINTAEQRLKAEMAKVVDGIRNDYRGAQATERALASALEAQRQEVLAQNRTAIGFRALSRDAASTQQMFDTLQQRVKETEIASELQANNIRILDRAPVPEFPMFPRTRVNLAAGFVGGMFIALVLVAGLHYLSPRIEEPEEIAESLGLSLIGVAPRVTALGDALSSMTDLPVPFQEAVRNIRAQIFLSASTASARTLAVTSTSPGEGKTVIAASLAVSIAKAGRRVLLVDADLRRPRLDQLFHVPSGPGLSNILAGQVTPSEALIQSSVEGLFVLPAGTAMDNAGDMLDHQRLNHLIQSFRQVFDLVVIDCPPVMAVADATIVANAAMSVLFVVGAGMTSAEVARGAVDRLTSVQARVVGVVLNKADLETRSEYYYGYRTEQRDAAAS